MTVSPIVCDPVWTSVCCKDQVCALCGQPAEAKVVEQIMHDDPFKVRRAVSAYLCANHFLQMMGPSAVMAIEEYRSRREDHLCARLAGNQGCFRGCHVR